MTGMRTIEHWIGGQRNSFGGWKDSLFCQRRMHGPDGVDFCTRTKLVTERWTGSSALSAASYHFPTSS